MRLANDEKQRQHRASVEKDQSDALQRILRADPKDYRTILNLSRSNHATYTTGEVTKAFRQASLLVHPDKNGSARAQEGFQKLQEAYSALKEEVGEGGPRPYYPPGASASAAPRPYSSGGVGGAGHGYGGSSYYRSHHADGFSQKHRRRWCKASTMGHGLASGPAAAHCCYSRHICKVFD